MIHTSKKAVDDVSMAAGAQSGRDREHAHSERGSIQSTSANSESLSRGDSHDRGTIQPTKRRKLSFKRKVSSSAHSSISSSSQPSNVADSREKEDESLLHSSASSFVH